MNKFSIAFEFCELCNFYFWVLNLPFFAYSEWNVFSLFVFENMAIKMMA